MVANWIEFYAPLNEFIVRSGKRIMFLRTVKEIKLWIHLSYVALNTDGLCPEKFKIYFCLFEISTVRQIRIEG